jgi:hypothetical protein
MCRELMPAPALVRVLVQQDLCPENKAKIMPLLMKLTELTTQQNHEKALIQQLTNNLSKLYDNRSQ